MKNFNTTTHTQNQTNLIDANFTPWYHEVKIMPEYDQKHYSELIEAEFWEALHNAEEAEQEDNPSYKAYIPHAHDEMRGYLITDPRFDEALTASLDYNDEPILRLLEYEPIDVYEFREYLGHCLKSHLIETGLYSLRQIECTWDMGLEDQAIKDILTDGVTDYDLEIFCGQNPQRSKLRIVFDLSNKPWVKYL
jgi:hypothetical protein